MKRVVVDASALAALTFNEPGADEVAERLEGAMVYAPTLLPFELANVAWKKMRRDPSQSRTIIQALKAALAHDSGITWVDVQHADAALLAATNGLTAYDASYVWLAGSLGADLVTLDEKLAERAKEDVG